MKIRWISLFLLLGLLMGKTVFAEAETPFGQPPGAVTKPIPEEEDFAGDDFGFAPPGGVADGQEDFFNQGGDFAPPPSTNPNPSPGFPPSANGGKNTLPSFSPPERSGSRGTEPTLTKNQMKVDASKGAANKDKNRKAEPKLADYLELDPSIRGLEVKNFDLPDKEIKDVVTLISKWTGKNFILDNKVRGKVTILAPSAVTLQEAYNAFLSALNANNLTTVQSGKFIQIIESSEARRSPVKTYSGDYAPKDDSFITRIFQLKYINADEVQREFRDLATRQGKLFAYEPTNSIIITDTGSNIQRIRDILEVLDVKSFETTLHVLRIKNGSAKTISDMLSEIYGDDKKGGNTRTFKRSALERTRGGGVISKIIPDEQTNSLIVLANESGFTTLVKLVGKLDIKSSDSGRIHVYYCEYAKAEDLANTLASLATGSGGSRSSTRRSSTNTGTSGTTGNSGASSGSSGGPVSAELEGGVKITSDPSTNSLVITANSPDYKTLKKVLKKLDIPRLQVFVETAIMEINIQATENRGVNLGVATPNVGLVGGFLGDSGSLIRLLGQGTSAGGLPASGLSIPLVAGESFQRTVGGQPVTMSTFMGLLNLLTSTTDSSILSTPQIIALDNEKAVFKVQDEIPVLGSSTILTGGGSQNSIDKIKVGIEMNITPHVNAASKSIRLDIEQSVDSILTSSDVPEALRNSNRGKTSRITNTSVVVKDQDYIMMGGLMTDTIDEQVTKVPLLGDIPILGWLFKSKTFSKKKKNLVVLLKPTLIGTTTAAANIINEKLEKRRDALGRAGREEFIPEEVDEYRAEAKKQAIRGRKEKKFDYRNNDDEEEPDVTEKKAENIKSENDEAPKG